MQGCHSDSERHLPAFACMDLQPGGGQRCWPHDCTHAQCENEHERPDIRTSQWLPEVTVTPRDVLSLKRSYVMGTNILQRTPGQLQIFFILSNESKKVISWQGITQPKLTKRQRHSIWFSRLSYRLQHQHPIWCQFESQLLRFWSSSLLMHLGEQQHISQALGSQHPHGIPR